EAAKRRPRARHREHEEARGVAEPPHAVDDVMADAADIQEGRAIGHYAVSFKSWAKSRPGYWKGTGPSGSPYTNWRTSGSVDARMSSGVPWATMLPSDR